MERKERLHRCGVDTGTFCERQMCNLNPAIKYKRFHLQYTKYVLRANRKIHLYSYTF